MAAQSDVEVVQRWSPVRELRESFMLLVFSASSLGALVGLGVLVVRLIASVR